MEQHAISSDLIRGHIDTIILHTLLDGDKYAQKISDAIEEKSENEYKINQATLYSSLKRLESLRYVKSYWYDADNGRRKYFSLTELGKQTVESNLSSWSYSRAIIDKLMDCAPEPVYKTQIIEKIVEKPVEVIKPVEIIKEVPVAVSPVVIPNTQPQNTVNNTVSQDEKVEIKAEETEKVEAKPVIKEENSQDINFRNILNGLIKSSYTPKTTDNEELQPLEKVDSDASTQPEVQKFNETITNIDYNAQRSNNGKIDFGDLMLNATKDGYRIRISSKDSFVTKDTILVNKLNFITSMISFLASIVALLVVSLIVGGASPIKNYVALIGSIAFAIAPIIYTVKYLLEPRLSSLKRGNKDEILTSIIIAFNVLVITLAVNFIFNVNFANVSIIAFTLVLPLVLSFIFVASFIVKARLSKAESFKLNAKK